MNKSTDTAPILPDAQLQDGQLQDDLQVSARLSPRPRYEGRKEFGLYVVVDLGRMGDSIPQTVVQLSFDSGHPDPELFVRQEAHRLNTSYYTTPEQTRTGEMQGGVVAPFNNGQPDDGQPDD